MCVPCNSGARAARSSAGSRAARAGRWSREARPGRSNSSTPRSMRPPPLAHDSISSPGWRALSSAISGRRRASARGRPGRPSRRVPGVEQVAVVVPLHVVDASSVDERARSARARARTLGVAEVEHVLVARRQRRRRARASKSHSGCSRARSESRLTISGSNHSPNSMPSSRTDVTAGRAPRARRLSTTQSPSELVSSRRPVNQPSSSTKRSTPTSAARSASSSSRQVVLEVDGLPGVEHSPAAGAGDGRPAVRGPGESARRGRRARRPTSRTATGSCTAPRSSTTSPGRSSSPRDGGCLPVAGVRSAASAWLPLQREVAPHTPPDRNPNPRSPATSSMACSSPGLPPRDSRTHSPTSKARRCGTRSSAQRPVRSSTSSASTGTGSASSSRAPGTLGPRSPQRRALAHEATPVQHLELDAERERVCPSTRARSASSPRVDHETLARAEHRRPPGARAVAHEPRPAEPALRQLRAYGHRLGVRHGQSPMAGDAAISMSQPVGVRSPSGAPQWRMRGSRAPPRSRRGSSRPLAGSRGPWGSCRGVLGHGCLHRLLHRAEGEPADEAALEQEEHDRRGDGGDDRPGGDDAPRRHELPLQDRAAPG